MDIISYWLPGSCVPGISKAKIAKKKRKIAFIVCICMHVNSQFMFFAPSVDLVPVMAELMNDGNRSARCKHAANDWARVGRCFLMNYLLVSDFRNGPFLGICVVQILYICTHSLWWETNFFEPVHSLKKCHLIDYCVHVLIHWGNFPWWLRPMVHVNKFRDENVGGCHRLCSLMECDQV